MNDRPTEAPDYSAMPFGIYGAPRGYVMFTGVMLPLMCHLATLAGPANRPRSQSGALHDQLAWISSGLAGWVFYPFLLHSMASLALLVYDERRFSGHRVVRWGVYAGVPLAAWYAAVRTPLDGAAFVIGFTAIGLLTPSILLVLSHLPRYYSECGPYKPILIVLGLAAVFLALIGAWFAGGGPMFLLAWILFGSFIFAPHLALATYVFMSARLVWLFPTPPRFHLSDLLLAFAWISAFLAACRWSVIRSLELYSQLPLENAGDCYIATAAARGHAPWVGGWTVATRSGGSRQVTEQLAYLKAAELAVRSLAPGWWSVMRRVYDRCGPFLARRLHSPWLADCAFVALLPAEWLARGGLRLLGVPPQLVRSLYQRQEPAASGPRSDKPDT